MAGHRKLRRCQPGSFTAQRGAGSAALGPLFWPPSRPACRGYVVSDNPPLSDTLPAPARKHDSTLVVRNLTLGTRRFDPVRQLESTAEQKLRWCKNQQLRTTRERGRKWYRLTKASGMCGSGKAVNGGAPSGSNSWLRLFRL